MTIDILLAISIAFTVCAICGHYRLQHYLFWGKCEKENCGCQEFKSKEELEEIKK